MPSLFKLAPAVRHSETSVSASERFTRALVELTRTVWHPSCTFDTAIGAICVSAAGALKVERVSIWHYDADARLLRCLHAYDATMDQHTPADQLESLSLEGDDYMAALGDVRTFEVDEINAESRGVDSHSALQDYLQRHRIQSLLDAPAFLDGALQGAICHESIDRVRAWSSEEITFAASMGDYVAMAYEIACRRRAESEIEHLRLHDPVTGLPNRDYMIELVRQRLASQGRYEHVAAVVHVQVDAYGGVSWTTGAPTLDDVMGRIAAELRRLERISVDLARVREQGFSFLLSRIANERSAIELAERAVSLLGAMRWNHDEIDPCAYAGVAFAEVGSAIDAQVLLHRAEEAAETASEGDKFGCAVFDPLHHATLVEGLRYERALRDAFDAGRFEVHYQPEFDAHDRTWVAAEALLRWRDGDRLVPAFEFIGVVESSGLMLPVGRWVLQKACLDAVGWPRTAQGLAPAIRVNVSARQFDEEGLIDDVTAALTASGLAPERLCLELTETTLMRNIDHAITVLRQLHVIGVQVAIDDFGTGYASLVYLKRLPIDVLKIDRSFVEGIPGAVADTAIVKAVVGLAGSLGIDLVAEGVERLEQQEALQAINVRRMQGWLYGKAMDNDSLCSLFAGSMETIAAGQS